MLTEPTSKATEWGLEQRTWGVVACESYFERVCMEACFLKIFSSMRSNLRVISAVYHSVINRIPFSLAD